MPMVRNILNKYKNRLPFMSHVKYNMKIKLIMKKLDETSTTQVRQGDKYINVPTWKLFSSHDLVRTFITIAADKGIPVTSIAQLTGKTIGIIEKNYLANTQQTAERHLLEKWSAQSS